MKIFEISFDVVHYKQLYDTTPEDVAADLLDEYLFWGVAKPSNWKTPTLRWILGEDTNDPNKDTYDQRHKIPDIAYWGPTALVLSPRATKIIKPLFIEEAQFLPVPVEDEEGWTVLNVTNLQDILDKANCRHQIRPDGKVGRMIEMALDVTKFTNDKLFKIKDKVTHPFTSDSPGSFKEIVEKNNLTGLEFLEL